ncbi:MAG: hypothetical protein ACR2MU_09405, partial [Gaiellaceae bacterium]
MTEPITPTDPGLAAPRGRPRVGGRGTLISSLSTVLVVGVVAVAVALSPGAGNVKRAFFSSHDFSKSVGPVWDGFLV